MGVRLRFQRMGVRNHPIFRLVALPARTRRDAHPLDHLGTYTPVPDHHGVKHMRMDVERIRYWLSVGALPTKSVEKILVKAGVVPHKPNLFNTLSSSS